MTKIPKKVLNAFDKYREGLILESAYRVIEDLGEHSIVKAEKDGLLYLIKNEEGADKPIKPKAVKIRRNKDNSIMLFSDFIKKFNDSDDPSSVIVSSKIASKVAHRFKVSFLSVKLPVNYALVVNCKKLLSESQIEADDEMLEEILSRYLDLVIYGLCNGASPSKEDLLAIAKEVVGEYDVEEDFDDEDFDDEFDFEDEGRF